MAVQILSNQDICFGGIKLQGALNKVAIDLGADALDVTTFASNGNREFVGGLKSLGFSAGGFFQGDAGAGGIDAALMDNLALEDVILTVCPQNAVAGGPAKFFQAVEASYSLGAEIGSVLGFDLTAQNSDQAGIIHGTLMLNATGLNASANGTGRQLGAIAAGKALYGAMHVFSAAGTTPSFTATVQSAAASNFTGATTRGTFTAATAKGAQWLQINGPVTDTWWRVNYAISGTGPAFGVMLSLGIK